VNLKSALMVPAAMAAILALGGPALAASVSYGSQSNPVKASEHSDAGNAEFYGAMSTKSAAYLYNSYNFRDSAPGGNSAYVTTDYEFLKTCNGTPNVYCPVSGGDTSSQTTSGTWIPESDQHVYDGNSTSGRMKTRVCEKQAHAIDDCSNYRIGTFSY
jgi:hypothetical protein